MAGSEIPLLRESATFSSRLLEATTRFADRRYHYHRRVNWSYRYGATFYAREAECFEEAPRDYLNGLPKRPPELDDVYAHRLAARQTIVVVVKVFVHWLFHLLGRVGDRRVRAGRIHTYRKCYVDDIELVYDVAESGVIRAVYPFPINVRRQLRYIAHLRRHRLGFKLAGNPYLVGDFGRFLVRRDVRSLMRLESRAQIRHAFQVVNLGVRTVQLSDEFDIGSLDFTRRLARFPVRVINSAHGVGKYLPVHGYPEFRVLTLKQQEYYHAIGPCRYSLRRLNERKTDVPGGADPVAPQPSPGSVTLVFLSQTFEGLTDVIQRNEDVFVTRVREAFEGAPGVRLIYKPHPNSKKPDAPAGFTKLSSLAEVNGRADTLFASFFSTCQIDPAFKGRKVLVRGHLVFPEIAFDSSEEILDLDELIALVTDLAARKGEQPC